MKLSFRKIGILGLLGVAQMASAQSISSLAGSIERNASLILVNSLNALDFGPALRDFRQFKEAATIYNRDLHPSNYENLKRTYLNSKLTMDRLTAARRLPQVFAELNSDMGTLIRIVDAPVVLPPPVRPAPPVVVPLPQPAPQPPVQPGRVITVTGEGRAGTDQGAVESCKRKAVERAIEEAIKSCARARGDYLNDARIISGPTAKKERGSRDDYKCEATASASCRVGR